MAHTPLARRGWDRCGSAQVREGCLVLLSRSGLSPAAISSEAAVSVPTPSKATSSGAASATRRSSCSSSSQISSESRWWRRATERSANLVAASTSEGAPISDLYHVPGATPQDQATLVLLWQATQGIFDALFGAGLLLVPIGFVALGVAMLGAPAFGKGFGGISVVLGVIGVVAASILLVDPLSPSAFVGVLALIAFHLVVGWKLYNLSRARREP
jgi:hypothetical protein